MLIRFARPLTAALFISTLAAAPAHALVNRAWVSGKGTDAAGCGAPTSPCRSFQYVHDNIIAAGGEIDVLDPAGYGAVTITKGLSIVNDGVGLAGVQQPTAGQNAITVNAGASRIHLRGLGIDGLGVALNGILVNSAGSVEIVNCVVRRFESFGIRVSPTSGTLKLFITDVLASDNGSTGIYVVPLGSATVAGLVKRAIINNNVNGLFVRGSDTTGRADVTVVDSTAAGHALAGFSVQSKSGAANATLLLDHVASSNNSFGLETVDHAVARITRSSFTRNVGAGVLVGVGGPVETFGDNVIRGNTTEISGGLTPVAQQ